uniref:Transmembrane protein n=1 Tax=Chrysotila carterae TaxID=13221 RepID=A0A7S4BMZ8_CHRCT
MKLRHVPLAQYSTSTFIGKVSPILDSIVSNACFDFACAACWLSWVLTIAYMYDPPTARAEPTAPTAVIGVRKTSMHTSMMMTRRRVLPMACVTGCTFFSAFIATSESAPEKRRQREEIQEDRSSGGGERNRYM